MFLFKIWKSYQYVYSEDYLEYYHQFQVICDINVQIATFRDLLIHVGTAKDAPELREKIRRVRRQCVEACKQTNNQLMPQIKT